MGRITEFRREPPDLYQGLPSNPDAEKYVLHSLLAGDVDFPRIEQSLRASDFTIESHRRIFAACGHLHHNGETIDTVTVAEELKRQGQLESVGGVSALIELDHGIPQIVNIDGWIKIIRRNSERRQLIFAADKIEKGALLETADPAALITAARAAFDKLDQGAQSSHDPMKDLPLVANHEITTSFLVEDLIPENSITLWTGSYGSGKSSLALRLASGVARGEPFLGRATRERPVLILDRENGLDCIKERMVRMGISDAHCPLRYWGVWGDKRQRPPAGPESSELLELVRRYKPFLIFDSLVAFANCDENSSNEMRAHLNWYRRLVAAGATVLILHHSSEKTESARNYRGSTDIPGSVDSAWLLSRSDQTGGQRPTRTVASEAVQDPNLAREAYKDRVSQ